MTTLAVANVGGHLRQLSELLPRLPADDVLWITNDNTQSRSMLADQRVLYLPYPRARSVADAVANARLARRALRGIQVDRAVSTGASLAVSTLPLLALRGTEVHYIESATRADGPSMSARLLRAVPGIRFYAQDPSWATGRWHYGGSVFDGYERVDRGDRPLRRVVVSLGTSSFSGFPRLVRRLVTLLPDDAEVLWQIGDTDVAELGIDGVASLPADRLEAAMAAADLVVCHAGTGSALTALGAGACPLLVPRDPAHGEHVDDHQFQIARRLAALDLAVIARVEDLDHDTLRRAATAAVQRSERPPPFRLVETGR